MGARVETGLDRIVGEGLVSLRGANVGLVINHTSVTQDLRFSVELFKKALKRSLKVVFTPEHGLLGDVADGVKISSYFDRDFEVHVFSLYGDACEPPRDIIGDLDVIVYDIQDIGVRWYTYISTLYKVMEAAGRVGVPVIVLDRPNPLTGTIIEGPLLDLKFRSFIGIADIPVRYGLTVGELSHFLNNRFQLGAEVRVARMKGWERRMWFDETGLLWVPTSPNIPTLNTALIYAGTCIFEATNVSEGRGTTKPFEYIGAPWLNWKKVLEHIGSQNIHGALLRAVAFRPFSSKYRGSRCLGFQIHVYDRAVFKPLRVALMLLEAIKACHEDVFEWIKRDNQYIIDKLLGTDTIRKRLEAGEKVDDFYDELEGPLKNYWVKAKNYLFYE